MGDQSSSDPDTRRYLTAWDLRDPVLLARTEKGLIQRVTCAGGSFAVLKCLSETGRRAEGSAPAILRAFDGQGAVRVLRSDWGAHLIEYAAGPDLLDLRDGHRDAVALPILMAVLRRLQRLQLSRPETVPSLPTLAARCRAIDDALDGLRGPDADLFRQARATADALLPGAQPALLHGDFHHGNVIRADRPEGPVWLAIDPQGLWGDPAYEVANLFGNPLGHDDVVFAPGRPARLAEALESGLGLPVGRTLGWAFVHSCISAAWSMEDGRNPEHRLRVARALRACL